MNLLREGVPREKLFPLRRDQQARRKATASVRVRAGNGKR
jgi:hypothetical protein